MPLPEFEDSGDLPVGVHRATQERIVYFEQLIAQFRVTSPDEFGLMSAAYIAEIEKMHGEVMGYLNSHSSEPITVEAA